MWEAGTNLLTVKNQFTSFTHSNSYINMYTVHSNHHHPQNSPQHTKENNMEGFSSMKQKSSWRGGWQWVVDIVGRARKRSWDLIIGLRGQGCTNRARCLVSIDRYLKPHPSKTVGHGSADEVLQSWCGERYGCVPISAGLYSIRCHAVVICISGYLRHTVQSGVLERCKKTWNFSYWELWALTFQYYPLDCQNIILHFFFF